MTGSTSVNGEFRQRLIALCNCTDAGKARPVLASVHFTPDRAYATDSYVAAWLDVDGPDEPKLVPARPLRVALNKAPKSADVTLEFGPDGLEVAASRDDLLTNTTTTDHIEYLNGKPSYPSLSKLMPDEHDYAVIPAGTALRPDLIERVAKVGRRYDNYVSFRLRRGDGESDRRPFIVESRGEVVGMVMGSRVNDDPSGVPDISPAGEAAA